MVNSQIRNVMVLVGCVYSFTKRNSEMKMSSLKFLDHLFCKEKYSLLLLCGNSDKRVNIFKEISSHRRRGIPTEKVDTMLFFQRPLFLGSLPEFFLTLWE